MSRVRHVPLVLLISVLAACASAATTRSDVNPDLEPDMSGWRSYAWFRNPGSYNDIMRARIERAVDYRMSALGFRVDSVRPDFRIGWHAGLTDKLDVQNITDLYGYGWRVWYGPHNRTFEPQYAQGTLVLDFVDTRHNELAWRGLAEGRLPHQGEALPTSERIDGAVEEILHEFPLRLEESR